MTYSGSDYYKALKSIAGGGKDTLGTLGGLTKEQAQKELADLEKAQYEATYTPSAFKMDDFSGLLNRLEASKMRQTGQKAALEGQNIFRTGLANMMTNF